MCKFEKYKNITQRWCDNFFDDKDLTNSLRPESISPVVDIRDFNVLEKFKKNEIRRLNEVKENQLKKFDKANEKSGKVLLFYPDRSLGDGLVFDVTSGFFSNEDVPPWGTWFYFEKNIIEGENILYCWISSDLTVLVDKALDVDYYNCLMWAD